MTASLSVLGYPAAFPPAYPEVPERVAPPATPAASVSAMPENVNVVEELVNMIQTQRAYEINSKAIQTSDQMLQKLTQL